MKALVLLKKLYLLFIFSILISFEASLALAQDKTSGITEWFEQVKGVNIELGSGLPVSLHGDRWTLELIAVRDPVLTEVKVVEQEIGLLQKQLATLGEEVVDQKPTVAPTEPAVVENVDVTDPKSSIPAITDTANESTKNTDEAKVVAATDLIAEQRAQLTKKLSGQTEYRKSLNLLLAQIGLLLDQIQARAASERVQDILTNRGGWFDGVFWKSVSGNIRSFTSAIKDSSWRTEIFKKVFTKDGWYLLGAMILFAFAVFAKLFVMVSNLSERLFIGTAQTITDQCKRLSSFLRWLAVFWGFLVLTFFIPLGAPLIDFISLGIAIPVVWSLAIMVVNKARMRTIAPAYSKQLFEPLKVEAEVSGIQWIFRTLLAIGLILVPVAFLFGYSNLGRLLTSAFATLALVLGGNLLVRGYLYRVVRQGGDGSDKHALLETNISSLGKRAPAYVGGEIIIMVASLVAVLPFFGVNFAEVGQFTKDIWQGVQFGPVYVQISSIVGAIIIFVLIWVLLKLLKSYLRHRVLPHTGWDEGVRDAILATVTYAGFGLMFLATVSTAGVDMSRLAIVAGALSVGIGFGLQTIVSNVVSGLILLYERSIKPGDWVIVDGNVEGTIRQVKVRYTEIETFNKSTVMVPNSIMVGGSVTNMTHRDKLGRIQIDIGIDYAVNPRDVLKVLQGVVDNFPMARKIPAPFVHFVGFGASSIDFAVKIYLTDIGAVTEARTKLAFEVYDAMQANDINIPFAQLDVNIRSNDTLPKEVAAKDQTDLGNNQLS